MASLPVLGCSPTMQMQPCLQVKLRVQYLSGLQCSGTASECSAHVVSQSSLRFSVYGEACYMYMSIQYQLALCLAKLSADLQHV